MCEPPSSSTGGNFYAVPGTWWQWKIRRAKAIDFNPHICHLNSKFQSLFSHTTALAEIIIRTWFTLILSLISLLREKKQTVRYLQKKKHTCSSLSLSSLCFVSSPSRSIHQAQLRESPYIQSSFEFPCCRTIIRISLIWYVLVSISSSSSLIWLIWAGVRSGWLAFNRSQHAFFVSISCFITWMCLEGLTKVGTTSSFMKEAKISYNSSIAHSSGCGTKHNGGGSSGFSRNQSEICAPMKYRAQTLEAVWSFLNRLKQCLSLINNEVNCLHFLLNEFFTGGWTSIPLLASRAHLKRHCTCR